MNLFKKGVSKDVIEEALLGEYKSEETALKAINKRKEAKMSYLRWIRVG